MSTPTQIKEMNLTDKTVKQLRELAKELGLKTKGIKTELTQKITEYLTNKQAVQHDSTMTPDILKKKTIGDLREKAKEIGFKKVRAMLKQELIENISAYYGNQQEEENITKDYNIADSISEKENDDRYTKTQQLLKGAIQRYESALDPIEDEEDQSDPSAALEKTRMLLDDLIRIKYPYMKHILNTLKFPYKFRVKIIATFKTPTRREEFSLCTRYIFPYEQNLKQTILSEFIDRVEMLSVTDSGWTLV